MTENPAPTYFNPAAPLSPARGVELEAAAAARLNQFRGLPANGGLSDVDTGPLAHTPTNADVVRIATAPERAVTDRLHVENDGAVDGQRDCGWNALPR